MTDIKKTTKNSRPAKAKKLQLNKETLKDLSAKGAKQVKGGFRSAGAGCSDGCSVPCSGQPHCG